jgi:hypothetical protein
MIRYYHSNGARLRSTERGGTSNGKRPKPLYGAKKYDRAFLKCTTPKCENVFYVSRASTPAQRFCESCFGEKSRKANRPTKRQRKNALFNSLLQQGIL